jgi:pimeloyl-ACP methyl ester carboxylesterase
MEPNWEIVESGPKDADHTVLLLPGGMCSARSYAALMEQPTLTGMRLVAVTLPGQAGAPAPDDFSVENYARMTAALARKIGCDVVVGFSMGATVAFEMAVTGAFRGPVVLLGASLSAKDEPGFFRAIIRLGRVFGPLPAAILRTGAASMARKAPLPPEDRANLAADFLRNRTHDIRLALFAYLRWLRRNDDPAARLCAAGVPVWVLHAEKGDGGLTQHERSTLKACSNVTLATVPGSVMFLPNEVPAEVAKLILEASQSAIGHERPRGGLTP